MLSTWLLTWTATATERVEPAVAGPRHTGMHLRLARVDGSVRAVAAPVVAALLVLGLVAGAVALSGGLGGDEVTVGPGSGATGGGEPGSPGSEVPGTSGTGSPAPGGPADGGQPMSRFVAAVPSPDGTSLTATFWGGVADCFRYRVTARETEQTVELTLHEKRRGGAAVCIELAQEWTRTISLDQPLGDRTVVDASNGAPVPTDPLSP